MRPALLVVLALILGFVLGWVSRPAAKPVSPGAVPLAPASTPATPPPAPSPAATTFPVAGPAGMEPGSTYRNRAETVRWLRQSGAPILFQVFGGDAFSSAFGKALELAPDEMARLNDAVLGTKRELDAARLARTTSRTSEDGKTLIVNVPAVDVSTSRAAYDRLLESLKSTLGPERYEVFNELGGEAFERGFDQFGLNNVRYELVFQPIFPVAGAAPHYEYKRHFLDASGIGKGWGGSTVSMDQIEKNDPILAHFIPRHLQSPAGK